MQYILDTTSVSDEASDQKTTLPPRLSIWTGYLLSRAGQRCREHFDTLMEPFGIRGRHFSVLTVLGEREALSQTEIGERLAIDRNTMVLLLDDLEKRAFVTRRRDPQNRRAHLVTLTDEGREMLALSTQFVRRTNEEVLAPLTADQQKQLHTLLLLLFEN